MPLLTTSMSGRAQMQAGFGLVEIMVGLVIGLLTTLVIMQVFTSFEGQKRTTSGSADAQTNGAVALYSISRDVQMAGYGLLPVLGTPMNCNPQPMIDHDNDPGTDAIAISVAPVFITDGGTSDLLSVVYGTSPTAGAPSTINNVTANTLTLNNNLGCSVGDVALIFSGAVCAAARITGPTDIANPPVASVPPNTTSVTLDSTSTMSDACLGLERSAACTSAGVPSTGLGAGASLACLGTWNRVTYEVDSGNLEVNGEPTIAGIVNMQVQYGISNTASDNQVASWVNAEDDWVAPTVADRNRIKAIRIAVIARNSLWERDVVSTACSSTTDPAPTGVCAWAGSDDNPAPTVDLSAQADWNHYRYRVFETIIPLRNTIWSREQL